MLILAALAVGFAGLGLYQAWHDSPTFDEPVYVAAGLASLTRHDLRLNPEHPPLAKALAALPALAVHPVIPHTAAWTRADERTYSAQFLQAQLRAGTLQRVMFAARLVPLAEAIAAAFVLYALARRLLSPAAGLVAGGLWLAGPLVLGLGHLDGIDLPFTLAALLVSLALVRVLELARLDPRARRRLLVLGLACGLAAVVKDTGLILAAMAPVMVAVSGWRDRRWATLVDAIAVGLVAWACIWVTYLVIAPGSVWPPGLLPHLDLTGLRYLSTNDTQSGPAYLLGSFWVGGRWWYWPLSLLIKVPLVTVAVLVVGPVGLAWVKRSVRWRTLAAVLAPAIAITAFTVPGPRDIGVRYLLPVLALWLVVAAAMTQVPRRARGGSHWPWCWWPPGWPRSAPTPIPSPGCRPPSSPATAARRTPTWTGARTSTGSRCGAPGAIRPWPTSGPEGSPPPRSPAPGSSPACPWPGSPAGWRCRPPA